MTEGFKYRFRDPFNTPESRGGTPPAYRRTLEHGMIIERDVAVRLRDGIEIYVNVFRPAGEKPAAPLIGWSPYGKHLPIQPERYVNAGIKKEHVSSLTAFEAPDPLYWVPRGYAVVNVDIRGTWYSKGNATYLSPEEAQDYYDVIEWAGTRPWSNGKVGLTGVSYLASSQWRVAELNPQHLAAINPWEGWSDSYREVACHGGIPDSWFWPFLHERWGASTTSIEDLGAETREHPFYDAFWQSKAADFSKITVPAYIVASWTDQGLHTRGTLEGFKRIVSKQKWLYVHGRKKWAHYYEPEAVKGLQLFFDHFLLGIPTEIAERPKVRLEVREKHSVGSIRSENEWPIARTRYTKLYLDAKTCTLQRSPIADEASCGYDARGEGPGAQFEVPFDEPTELIGHMKLKLFMAAEGGDDMDIFVAVQKLDRAGQIVPFPYYAQFDDGPVALGWLRASHRELDRERSTEYQPILAHQRELKIADGAMVPLEIEIWPSGTRFDAGERLRLVIQGTDIYQYPKSTAPVYYRHEDTVNKGRHVIHTGGKHESYLLVPVVPK